MYLYELQAFLDRKVPKNDVFVVPYDMLSTLKFDLPAGFIVNLSKANEVGTHWTSFWIDEHGRASYFDSYGFKPAHREILNFLKMHCKSWVYNDRQFQQPQSNVCGFYAAAFIFYMARNISIDIFKKQFTHNLTINDIIIAKIFEKINN